MGVTSEKKGRPSPLNRSFALAILSFISASLPRASSLSDRRMLSLAAPPREKLFRVADADVEGEEGSSGPILLRVLGFGFRV